MINEMTIYVKLKRIDVCDLLLACVAAKYCANDGGDKWTKLHEELKKQLDEFDKEVEGAMQWNERTGRFEL